MPRNPADTLLPLLIVAPIMKLMKKAYLIAVFDGVTKTAEALGIKQSSVSGWGEDVPESAIGRLVQRHLDVYLKWYATEGRGEVEQRHQVRRSGKGRRSDD